jgi:hypothetical protein
MRIALKSTETSAPAQESQNDNTLPASIFSQILNIE